MGNKGYSRKPGSRSPREAVAIFTEGEVTEVKYLEYVLHKLGIPKELVQIHPSVHSDPKGLVDDAVAAKKDNAKSAKRRGVLIENWWVLADTECGRPGLHDAVQKAKDNSIWLGFCDPSVEFWLLLHFRYTTQSFDSVKKLIHQLKQHLPRYDEGNKYPEMDILFPLLPIAIENALKLRKNLTTQGHGSPRTDLDLLIAELNCQAGKGSELFLRKKPDRHDLSMYHCGFN